MRSYSFYILIILFVVSSCNKQEAKTNLIDEGTISYSMNYSEEETTQINKSILPSKLQISFNKENVYNKVTNNSCLVNTAYVINNKTNKNFIIIKFLGKKLIYFEEGEKFMLFEDFQNMQIVPTNEFKEIAGKRCCKSIVNYLENGKQKSFDIFYIPDVSNNNIYKGTPYSNIPGILMDFKIKLLGKEVHVVANEINSEPIDTNLFNIPKNFEEVNKETLYEIIGLLK